MRKSDKPRRNEVERRKGRERLSVLSNNAKKMRDKLSSGEHKRRDPCTILP